MSTTSDSGTGSRGRPSEWQYPRGLHHELNGAFVHPNDDPEGLFNWVFSPTLKGTFLDVRIDSGDEEDVIGPIEAERAERAFRDGYLKAAKEAVAEFGSLNISRQAFDRLLRRERKALYLRKRQQRATEAALPCVHWPEQAGRVVYALGHWIDGARRRGYHHAWAFIDQDWLYLETVLNGPHSLPHPIPDDASFLVLRDRILPKWLEAVKAWHATPDVRWPPPQPIGERAGTKGCLSTAAS